MSPPPPSPTPTAEEIADFRDARYQLLAQAQAAYRTAQRTHEEFRNTHWLPTPRRRRAPLAPEKEALAAALTQAREHRDAVLTDPATLAALTAAQREAATGLTRQGRRNIEAARGLPPTHPGYARTAPPPDPTTTEPEPEPEPEGATTS